MSGSLEQLNRWVEAGLLTVEQAEAISRFEQQRAVGDAAEGGSPPAARAPDRRSLGVEAIGYVGAALAIGAIALLIGEVWEELVVGGRLALVALLTVMLGGGGLALHRITTSPMQRLTSVLLAGAVAGVAWFTFVLGGDVLALGEADLALLTSTAAATVALAAYAPRPRPLPQLVLLAALLAIIGALFGRAPLTPDPVWVGLTVWGAGVAWLLLGAGRWIRPRRVAEVAGGVVALVGAQIASFDDARLPALVLGLLTAAALVTFAILGDRVHHLAVGAVGLFVLVPQLVFELFGDAIGAPATLLVVGLLLVLLAVGLGRARRSAGP